MDRSNEWSLEGTVFLTLNSTFKIDVKIISKQKINVNNIYFASWKLPIFEIISDFRNNCWWNKEMKVKTHEEI